MRFLANENFPLGSIRGLRDAGHDVAAVGKDSPGAKDAAVLAPAVAETRIILTFDRDYGELIYRVGLPAPPGVVYFRFEPASPDEPAAALLSLLADGSVALECKLTVVEPAHVRQRPLP